MERRADKSLLVLFVLLSCILVSSVPMTRSLRLGTITHQQQHPLALTKHTSSVETTIAAAMNLGRPEARMDVEVNDYPMPSANDDHDPGRGSRDGSSHASTYFDNNNDGH